jgi:hypothetical protein
VATLVFADQLSWRLDSPFGPSVKNDFDFQPQKKDRLAAVLQNQVEAK